MHVKFIPANRTNMVFIFVLKLIYHFNQYIAHTFNINYQSFLKYSFVELEMRRSYGKYNPYVRFKQN